MCIVNTHIIRLSLLLSVYLVGFHVISATQKQTNTAKMIFACKSFNTNFEYQSTIFKLNLINFAYVQLFNVHYSLSNDIFGIIQKSKIILFPLPNNLFALLADAIQYGMVWYDKINNNCINYIVTNH